MLRPTESAMVWLQQLGRGLRRAEGKEALHVVDYIGNHRSFLTNVRALLAAPKATVRWRRGWTRRARARPTCRRAAR